MLTYTCTSDIRKAMTFSTPFDVWKMAAYLGIRENSKIDQLPEFHPFEDGGFVLVDAYRGQYVESVENNT